MKLRRIALFSTLVGTLPFGAHVSLGLSRKQACLACRAFDKKLAKTLATLDHGRRHVKSLAVVMLAIAGLAGQAQGNPTTAAELFKDADLALGSRLIQEHRCAACHVRQVGGDGSAIYRPKGRINTAGFLRGMVEQCNTEMKLGMFPDEVSSVAAVLNRDHYRFK